MPKFELDSLNLRAQRVLGRLTRGVQNFAKDTENRPNPRYTVYWKIDHAPFQKWVVFVAGVGFLTDAYEIFALNLVLPILGFVYWDKNGIVPHQYKTALVCVSLVGTLFGQIMFGILGDLLGRRKTYGFELIIIMVGTLGVATSSSGADNSMSILGWLLFWRFVTGVGIGADYSISAALASEFAPRAHRSRMLATTFWCQSIGQLAAILVSMVVLKASESGIPSHFPTCKVPNPGMSIECTQVLDRAWRWIVGFGIAPGLIAVFFRLTIPKSPRFLLEKEGDAEAARESIQRLLDPNGNEVDAESKDQAEHERVMISNSENELNNSERRVAFERDYLETDEGLWHGIHKYFISEGNWRYLLGTALSWFLIDLPFYGLSLSSSTIVYQIWSKQTSKADKNDLYSYLFKGLTHELIIVNIGAVVGGLVLIKVIKYISAKRVQFWGFIALALLFIIVGSAFEKLVGTGLVVFYVLIQLVFNLGPNSTTYIIPAELFPTRYRCTCIGISAASGKLGSIIIQLFLAYVKFDGENYDTTSSSGSWLGNAMQVFSAFMAAGAIVTWTLVPESRDRHGQHRSLEVLAQGRRRLKELSGETAWEDLQSNHEQA